MTGSQIVFFLVLSFLCGWALHRRIMEGLWSAVEKAFADGSDIADDVIEMYKRQMTKKDWTTVVRILLKAMRDAKVSEQK